MRSTTLVTPGAAQAAPLGFVTFEPRADAPGESDRSVRSRNRDSPSIHFCISSERLFDLDLDVTRRYPRAQLNLVGNTANTIYLSCATLSRLSLKVPVQSSFEQSPDHR